MSNHLILETIIGSICFRMYFFGGLILQNFFAELILIGNQDQSQVCLVLDIKLVFLSKIKDPSQ